MTQGSCLPVFGMSSGGRGKDGKGGSCDSRDRHLMEEEISFADSVVDLGSRSCHAREEQETCFKVLNASRKLEGFWAHITLRVFWCFRKEESTASRHKGVLLQSPEQS